MILKITLKLLKTGFLKILFFFCLILFSEVAAQNITGKISVTDTFRVNLQNSYRISKVNILPGTELLRLNNRIIGKSEYYVNYHQCSFSLSDSLRVSLLDTLIISYESYYLAFQEEYKRRELVISYDDKFQDTVSVSRNISQPLTSESIFGPGIQKSGSIIRGFTVGNTRDLTVNSGLRLQMSGNLTENIEIVAALTDENTPIQPEGNTETLDELDKVFIEVRHPNAVGTFGDYDYKNQTGEFGKIDRKLQGLKGEVNYSGQNGVVAFATSKGKFTTNQFNGSDGNQGPYRLTGESNERNIIIIAGSEKVFVDGEEMTRGEGNDYTIEYGNAEIIFTTRRLITSASRITVDFEYSDRKYTRNFFGANAKTTFLNNRLKVRMNYFREGDDEKSPIDLSLTEDEIKILEKAGDTPENAYIDGAVLAEADSLGNRQGIYTRRDTTISGNIFTYYIYKPGQSSSEYNVTFSYVGSGEGDYIKESLGNYAFAGKGGGSYLPIKILPLPQLKQTANVLVQAEILKGFSMDVEFGGSSFDKNRFSHIDDKDNSGFARNISLKLQPTETGAGKLGFSLRDRYIEERFSSVDRVNSIEFDRDYNTSSGSSGNEILREAGVNYIPVDSVFLNASYGMLKKGNSFKSDRYLANTNFEKAGWGGEYNFDYVRSRNSSLLSDWTKQEGDINKKIWWINPGTEFYFEEKKDRYQPSDSLIEGSLKYREIVPYLKSNNIQGFEFQVKYSVRDEYFPVKGKIEKQSEARTQNYSANYSDLREFNTSLDVTFRDKRITDSFKKLGYTDNETVLIRSQSRTNLFDRFISGDLFYEVSTQKTAQLEKVFLQVEEGTGNYIYLGDLNNNGLPDENEFEQTIYEGDYILTSIATDELFPVIDLKTNTRWQFDFSKIFSKYSFWGKYLGPLSTETLWRIEENSKEKDTKKIYLLNFSSFLNENTTIRGSNLFQQDFYLYKNEREFSGRVRYIQRKNMSQYSTGLEKGYFRENSFRIETSIVRDISNQTEYIRQTDNVAAPDISGRARTVSSEEASTEFSYRPYNQVEVGFKFGVGKTDDTYPEKPTEINTNSQLVRINISFAGKGRLRIETERDELNANTSENYIPFEVTKGNRLGKNYQWRLMFDYRIAENLQTSVNYNGRILGGGTAVHTMKAEVRAFF